MAQEIVGFKLVLDGKEKVISSIGEMKKLLKEANFELLAAQQNFGEYSAEAVAAARKVANLKDTIREAKETSDLFDPGKKFQAFAGAITAVAGGFSAVQGALGLVGVESQNVEKTLLKVQSALALSQGLSTIADAQKDFARLASIIKDTSAVQGIYNFVMKGTINGMSLQNAITKATAVTMNFFKTSINGVKTASITTAGAMRVLRGVIASLGIGALIFGVTTLISAISNWVGSTDDAKAANDKLNETLEEQNRIFDKNKQRLKEAREDAIADAKVRGKSAEEIFKINKEYSQKDIDEAQRNTNEKRKLLNDFQKKNLETFIQDGQLRVKGSEKDIEQYKKLKQEFESADKELSAARRNAVKEEQDEQIRIADDRRTRQEKAAEQAKQLSEKQREERKKEREEALQAEKDANQKLRDLEDENFAATIKDETERALVKLSQQKERDILEIQQTKATAETKARLIAEIENQFRIQKDEVEAQAVLARQEREKKNEEERSARIREQFENDKKLREEFQQAELEAEKFLQEQKNALLDAGINLALALAGRNEKLANAIYAVQKAVEIGRIISSTTGAIAKIKADTFAIPPFVGPGLPNPLFFKALASMGTRIAGLKIGAAASIASIAATSISKFKSGSGGGNIGGTQETGSVGGGATAPIAPQAPVQATLTQLDQATINRLGSATNRAYVVESDITNSQERIRRINRAARLN